MPCSREAFPGAQLVRVVRANVAADFWVSAPRDAASEAVLADEIIINQLEFRLTNPHLEGFGRGNVENALKFFRADLHQLTSGHVESQSNNNLNPEQAPPAPLIPQAALQPLPEHVQSNNPPTKQEVISPIPSQNSLADNAGVSHVPQNSGATVTLGDQQADINTRKRKEREEHLDNATLRELNKVLNRKDELQKNCIEVLEKQLKLQQNRIEVLEKQLELQQELLSTKDDSWEGIANLDKKQQELMEKLGM